MAPNPRRTRIFLAEKGISVPTEQVDIMAMQHKTPEYAAINPLQRMPALELDDGTVITELIAICRYFEALQPEPPLFGVGAKDIALVEMWNRRCEIHFFANVAAVFRHLHPSMKELEVPQCPPMPRPCGRGPSGSSNCSTASLASANSSPASVILWPISRRCARSTS